jgi:amino acid permease
LLEYKTNHCNQTKMAVEDQAVVSEDKSQGPVHEKEAGITFTSSNDGVEHGEIEPVGTTKRGLKARHAQMIALGGTIGKLPSLPGQKGRIVNF